MIQKFAMDKKGVRDLKQLFFLYNIIDVFQVKSKDSWYTSIYIPIYSFEDRSPGSSVG